MTTSSNDRTAVAALMRLAVGLMPDDQREWGIAMQNEVDHVGRGPQGLAWALGCLWTAVAQRLAPRPWLYLFALAVGIALVGFFEWRTDEATVTLSVILLASLILGALKARAFWLTGVLIGATVYAVDLFARLSGLHPIYEHAARTPADPTTLVLMVPALIAAAVGAGLSALVRPKRPKP
jgi:hypothetical protein